MRETPDGVLIVLADDLSGGVAQELLKKAEAAAARTVEIDLSRVRRLDSTGVDVFLTLARRHLRTDRRLVIRNAEGQPAERLRSAGLEHLARWEDQTAP